MKVMKKQQHQVATMYGKRKTMQQHRQIKKYCFYCVEKKLKEFHKKFKKKK